MPEYATHGGGTGLVRRADLRDRVRPRPEIMGTSFPAPDQVSVNERYLDRGFEARLGTVGYEVVEANHLPSVLPAGNDWSSVGSVFARNGKRSWDRLNCASAVQPSGEELA